MKLQERSMHDGRKFKMNPNKPTSLMKNGMLMEGVRKDN
jgi:hypothetical protein